MAQLNVVSQSDKTTGHTQGGEKLKQGGDKVNGQRTGPIQASIQRMPRSPEARRESSRRAEQGPVSRVTRFNAPAPDAEVNPSFQQGTWLRPLVVGLILVALIPNITLAVVLWLGLIDPPWSKQETPPQPAPTQAPTPTTVLTTPATLEATAGETIKFPIALDGTDGVPARSIIAISGLPPGSTLSDGRPYGDEWNLKSDQIGDLHLALPLNAHGEMQIAISLIGADDTVIADTETILKVAPAPNVPPARSGAPEPAADNDEGQADGPAAEEPNEDDGATAAVAAASPAEEASAVSSASPQASDEPTPVKADANSTGFVRPSAYVNLREGPSSSSRVIGVIAKGTKLPVLARRRGWVEVSNPATSDKGWIYSGYVGGESHHHARPRKRAASPGPEQKSESSSFWGWLTQ